MSTKPIDVLEIVDKLREAELARVEDLTAKANEIIKQTKDPNLLSQIVPILMQMKNTSYDAVRRLTEILDNQKYASALSKLRLS